MKKELTAFLLRWVGCSVLIWMIIAILFSIFAIHEDIDYAKYNTYASEHLPERIAFSIREAFSLSIPAALLFSQPAFLVGELISRIAIRNSKDPKIAAKKSLPIPAIVALSVLVVIGLIVVTMPLWFHLEL